jgi:hypothetical protein
MRRVVGDMGNHRSLQQRGLLSGGRSYRHVLSCRHGRRIGRGGRQVKESNVGEGCALAPVGQFNNRLRSELGSTIWHGTGVLR